MNPRLRMALFPTRKTPMVSPMMAWAFNQGSKGIPHPPKMP
jgi:hypothetical protein